MRYQSYQTPRAKTSLMAIISLLSSLAGLTLLPILGSIVAVISGHMAIREISESLGQIQGNGLAKIGLLLGYLGIAIGLLAFCAFVFLVLNWWFWVGRF
ncbi:MAG: DUF4190 domain-containing protein [Chloroflexi bacterium]|nr:DUF4190 domain-containing protein [Chloroflexota bacterium]